MKRKRTGFVVLLGLSATLFSCTTDIPDEQEYQKAIRFLPAVAQTRSAMEEGFVDGDSIGIYMTTRLRANEQAKIATSASFLIENKAFGYDGGSLASDNEFYWKTKEDSYDVYAYYPYNGNPNIPYLSLQVDTDQSRKEKLRHSDFLYDRVSPVSYDSNGNGIPLHMNHLLTKLNISVVLKDSRRLADCIVKVTGVRYAGTVDLNTGSVTSYATLEDILPYHQGNGNYECILFPQSVGKDTNLIEVSFSEEDDILVFVLNKDLTFESGKEYSIELKE